MLNRREICGAVVAMAVAIATEPALAAAADNPISPKARQLLHIYDGLGVETKWPAGVHVNWETGVPDGAPERLEGRHTHCSAFVASVAKQLGIYVLRPPEHGQVLLANAQLEWLETSGGSRGWQSLPDAAAAQKAANAGLFVVASYRSHLADKPGHIAIVRAGLKTPEQIATDGPDVIQAGTYNYTTISLANGFAGHPYAWATAKEVRFYAHEWAGKWTAPLRDGA